MYAENLFADVEALVEKLKSKRYQAKLLRRQCIPKGNGNPQGGKASPNTIGYVPMYLL